jgi:hypothetical protein
MHLLNPHTILTLLVLNLALLTHISAHPLDSGTATANNATKWFPTHDPLVDCETREDCLKRMCPVVFRANPAEN